MHVADANGASKPVPQLTYTVVIVHKTHNVCMYVYMYIYIHRRENVIRASLTVRNIYRIFTVAARSFNYDTACSPPYFSFFFRFLYLFLSSLSSAPPPPPVFTDNETRTGHLSPITRRSVNHSTPRSAIFFRVLSPSLPPPLSPPLTTSCGERQLLIPARQPPDN